MSAENLHRPSVCRTDVYAEMAGLAWERINSAYLEGAIETFEDACNKFDEWRAVHLHLGYLGITSFL